MKNDNDVTFMIDNILYRRVIIGGLLMSIEKWYFLDKRVKGMHKISNWEELNVLDDHMHTVISKYKQLGYHHVNNPSQT